MSTLCGNGGLYLPQKLNRGADGAMTDFAYVEALVETVRLHRTGKADRAEDGYDCYLPILGLEQQQLGMGPAVCKHALMCRGAIAHAALRAPGPKLSATDVTEIDRLMAAYTEAKRRVLG